MEIRRAAEVTMEEVVTGVHNTKLAEDDRMNVLQFEIDLGDSVPRPDHPQE